MKYKGHQENTSLHLPKAILKSHLPYFFRDYNTSLSQDFGRSASLRYLFLQEETVQNRREQVLDCVGDAHAFSVLLWSSRQCRLLHGDERTDMTLGRQCLVDHIDVTVFYDYSV